MSWDLSPTGLQHYPPSGGYSTAASAGHEETENLFGTFHCPGFFGGFDLPHPGDASYDETTSVASDAYASLPSPLPLVQIKAYVSVEVNPGYPDCDHTSSPTWEVSTFEFGGEEVELRDDFGVIVSPSDLPIIGGAWLMRPTPVAWPGQDIANEANRTLWLPSELGDFHVVVDMIDISGYIIGQGALVDSWREIESGPDVSDLIICFV